MGNYKKRDDILQEEMGIYQGLMEDFEVLANIFIGNETFDEFENDGTYNPLLRLVADIQFSPENDRIHDEVIKRIKVIEEKLLKLRSQIDSNYKKAKFIYRNQ